MAFPRIPGEGSPGYGPGVESAGFWSAQAALAPSLYEATLRSPCRLRRRHPGNVGFFNSFENDVRGTERDLACFQRNVGYAVRTIPVRTAYPTCFAMGSLGVRKPCLRLPSTKPCFVVRPEAGKRGIAVAEATRSGCEAS